jgi:hypothetical protein
MSVARSWLLAWGMAASACLAGCANAQDKAVVPAPTSKVKVTTVKLPTGKETFLVATSKVDKGIFFTRPPYDMNGVWRTEATCGIYQTSALAASTGASFGLEADLRGATPTPSQYYGLYARYFQTPSVGLQVYAVSHTSNTIGQHFFANATAVDLAIQTNGTIVTYLARDSAAGGGYTTIGATALATPSGAHQPGIGFFSAAQGTTIGFTNFRVPANGSPAVAVAPEQDAMNAVYQAAFNALDAAYAVDGPVVDAAAVTAAQGYLDTATTSLAAARTKIEGLAKAPPTPKQKALAAVIGAQKALAGAHTAFAKKGTKEAAAYVKTVTGKLYTAAWKVTDALIPADLRAALPTGGLHH